MFYNQDGTKDLVVHNVDDKYDVRKIGGPNEAACCDLNNNLYSVKHSGFFDFEIDENGLWMIYKLESNQSSDNLNNQISSNTIQNTDSTYVVAKIKESNFKDLVIEKNGTLI